MLHDKRIKWACCAISAIIFIFLIVLLPLSFVIIDQNSVGFAENKWREELRGPLPSGFRYKRPADTITEFPITIQNSTFVTDCMTYDKIEINLTISMSWKYDTDRIIDVIYKKFDNYKNYLVFLESKITSSVMQTCSNFTTIDTYDIRNVFETKLYDNFIKDTKNYKEFLCSNFTFFQLISIVVPQNFTEKVNQRTIILTDQTTQLNNRTSLITNANTELLKAKQIAIQNQIKANNTANLYILEANKTAEIIQKQWEETTNALLSIKTINNWNNSQLLYYMYQLALKRSNNSIINLETFMTNNF
jgi:SPFH domain / Band 7 family.